MRSLFLSLFLLAGNLFANEVRLEFSSEDSQKYKIGFSKTKNGGFQIQGAEYSQKIPNYIKA